jgi:MFS family permease
MSHNYRYTPPRRRASQRKRESLSLSPRSALRNARDRVDRAEARVFHLLWVFLPAPSVGKRVAFQHLVVSRFLSDMAQQALLFGVLVALARHGASSFQIALVGIAALIPPATLGLYGGIAADALSKRVALVGTYGLQATLCFLVPVVLGTTVLDVMLLLLAVHALAQISLPAESSAIPLVASDEELASATSLIGMASAVGMGLGAALVGPVVVRVFGVNVMIYLAGILLLVAASRVFNVPSVTQRAEAKYETPRAAVRTALDWLVHHPAVLTMIVVGVLSGTANTIIQTLGPRYVQSALGVDPADAAYVFAPSTVGLILALIVAPLAIRLFHERVSALVGLFLTVTAVFLLGMVGTVSGIVDPVNPLRVTGLIGINLGEKLRTAGFLALPLAFGVSLTSASIQTYINRRVPVRFQGRTFAMQSWLRNGTAIFPLLGFGALATVFGMEKVLLITPVVLIGLGYGLVYWAIRIAGLALPGRREVFESFLEESPQIARDL